MAKITVDGIVYEVDPAGNLLQECLSHGLDLPYFCWHPCMGSVGACRQCAVKQYRNADDKTGTLVMACMTPATDGSMISIKDPQAVSFRAMVIESLMISHPHDCPVCEEGGECHLQDMTQMSGHNYRRHDFNKVTHRNQYLGPFINHEMNRCISCYRCVRFYNDYAGGEDLAVLASHHHVYFGRHEEGTLVNEFSGNLVEVCPTGVFTDKTFSRHYTRKWDLQTAPSICTGCGVGCNTTPGEREGRLRRIVNRYHHELNGYFLCDRGRFGHGYSHAPQRLLQASALSKRNEHRDEKPQRETLTGAAADKQLQLALKNGKTIGIGSPRASLESNLALRERVGADNFHAGYSDGEYACLQEIIALYQEPGLRCPALLDIEQSDCVLVFNEDISNTAPRLALAVRQATRNKARTLAEANRIPAWQDAAVRSLAQHERSPLILIGSQGTRLDELASTTRFGSVAEQIDLLEAVTAALASAGKDPVQPAHSEDPAQAIAATLLTAKRPVLISGISAESPALVRAVATLARTLYSARHQTTGDASQPLELCFAMPEVNTMGLALLLESGGAALGEALQTLADGEADTLLVLENDLSRRCPAPALAAALAADPALIVLDQVENRFNANARLLLPVSSFAEQHGTWVNYEGRAQSAYKVYQAAAGLRSAAEWLGCDWHSLEEKLLSLTPFQKLAELQVPSTSSGMKYPRQSHRYSGRTALTAASQVHERQQARDQDSALAFSMEGVPLQKDASLLSAAWAPGWNSNQAISKFQEEINGELRQGCKGVQLLTATFSQRLPPAAGSQPDSFPATDNTDPEQFQVFFIQHVFGSDELSALAPAIQERSCEAYLSLSSRSAAALGLKQYARVQIESGNCRCQLPVLIRERIGDGSAGIYCGNSLNRHDFAATVRITALPAEQDMIMRQPHGLSDLPIPDRAIAGQDISGQTGEDRA